MLTMPWSAVQWPARATVYYLFRLLDRITHRTQVTRSLSLGCALRVSSPRRSPPQTQTDHTSSPLSLVSRPPARLALCASRLHAYKQIELHRKATACALVCRSGPATTPTLSLEHAPIASMADSPMESPELTGALFFRQILEQHILGGQPPPPAPRGRIVCGRIVPIFSVPIVVFPSLRIDLFVT